MSLFQDPLYKRDITPTKLDKRLSFNTHYKRYLPLEYKKANILITTKFKSLYSVFHNSTAILQGLSPRIKEGVKLRMSENASFPVTASEMCRPDFCWKN